MQDTSRTEHEQRVSELLRDLKASESDRTRLKRKVQDQALTIHELTLQEDSDSDNSSGGDDGVSESEHDDHGVSLGGAYQNDHDDDGDDGLSDVELYALPPKPAQAPRGRIIEPRNGQRLSREQTARSRRRSDAVAPVTTTSRHWISSSHDISSTRAAPGAGAAAPSSYTDTRLRYKVHT